VSAAIKQGVAVPAFSASLAYFDSYRQARLPANLLQAQRDFFGAHTYERIDKPRVFHTEWIESEQKPTEKPTEPKTPEPHHAGEGGIVEALARASAAFRHRFNASTHSGKSCDSLPTTCSWPSRRLYRAFV